MKASFVHCLLVLFAGTSGPATNASNAIEIYPSQILLTDAMARQQILVDTAEIDATRVASYSSRDANIVTVDKAGHVTPLSDGNTQIVVTVGGHTASVLVKVSGMKDGRPVDFVSDIVPILSRHGCNSGGCHGKAAGQNGFQLSLFGFDNDFDYDAIAKEGRGRHIFTTSTSRSMLLASSDSFGIAESLIWKPQVIIRALHFSSGGHSPTGATVSDRRLQFNP